MTKATRAEAWLVAIALVVAAVVLGLGLALLVRPSPECSETCMVLDGEPLFQVWNQVWCYDRVHIFATRCAE